MEAIQNTVALVDHFDLNIDFYAKLLREDGFTVLFKAKHGAELIRQRNGRSFACLVSNRH